MFALNMANAALCVIGILLFNGIPLFIYSLRYFNIFPIFKIEHKNMD